MNWGEMRTKNKAGGWQAAAAAAVAALKLLSANFKRRFKCNGDRHTCKH